MKKLFVRLGLFILRCLLKLRYRVVYKGLNELKKQLKDPKKGVLFLANHPAVLVDPMAVCTPLVQLFTVRPLMVEFMYYNPLFNWAMRVIKALPIPNFTTGVNNLKLKRAEKMLQAIAQGLADGESFLIYPAGMTKQTGKEVIGGAFGVHQLLSGYPDIQVVLIRTTGLWGSVFSRAYTRGEQVNMADALKHAAWTVLKNMVFFVPKRQVLVEFELAPSTLPITAPKAVFNQYLDEWYNKPFTDLKTTHRGEPLKRVSYSFWKNDFLEVQEKPEEKIDVTLIPQEIKDAIIAKVAELAKQPKETITPSMQLTQDLGLDSLDIADLTVFFEDQYNVSSIKPNELTTVARLFTIAYFPEKREEVQEEVSNLQKWLKHVEDGPLAFPEGTTIPEVFLKQCDGRLRKVACADSRAGVMTVFRFKKAILTLARRIEQLPGERVGILLPASAGAFILVIACQLAGKVPVMINWTVGGRHLDTVVDISGIQAVLTSWIFLDNLESVDLTRIEGLLVILEEFRTQFTLSDLCMGFIQALCPSRVLLNLDRFAHLKSKSQKEAVILFTSGTENAPKGVPLTHSNILENHRAILKTLPITKKHILLSMLPPFHSFGFSVTGLLSLLSGVRVIFYPNPTDAKRLAKAIDHWRVTILCSAPTFLRNICIVARDKPFASLRMVISGAERLIDDVYNLIRATCPQARVCEGYGITECAPVLTVNSNGERGQGVGRSLPGVEMCVVHPETHEPLLDRNATGLLLASGPNIFPGYLNPGLASPFITHDQKIWYNTGDLGRIDDQGNVFIAGRYKRFVKLGGEMISLTALEEALHEQGQSEGVQFAVYPHGEDKGRLQLVLFTTKPMTQLEANQALRKKGFGNLVKIDQVVPLEAIPLTGTGKVSYPTLEKLLIR